MFENSLHAATRSAMRSSVVVVARSTRLCSLSFRDRRGVTVSPHVLCVGCVLHFCFVLFHIVATFRWISSISCIVCDVVNCAWIVFISSIRRVFAVTKSRVAGTHCGSVTSDSINRDGSSREYVVIVVSICCHFGRVPTNGDSLVRCSFSTSVFRVGTIPVRIFGVLLLSRPQPDIGIVILATNQRT